MGVPVKYLQFKTKSFIKEYKERVRRHKTQKEAYESLEKMHRNWFGEPKFSGFDSFKKVLKYYNRKENISPK